jgi:hypothetical protein
VLSSQYSSIFGTILALTHGVTEQDVFGAHRKTRRITMNMIVGRLAEFALVTAGASFYAVSVMNLLMGS